MRCTLCKQEYAWSKRNGTGVLHGHMKRTHPKQYAALRFSSSDTSSVVSSAAASAAAAPKRTVTTASLSSDGGGSAKAAKLDHRQPTMRAAFAPLMNDTLAAATARFFASNHIAYNVASSESFCDFANAVRHSNVAVLQREGVKAAIEKLEVEMREQLWALLRRSSAPIAIAIDGWTNVKHTKVLNVILICSNRAYYWRSIANKLDKSDAQWMESVLRPVIAELVDGGVRVSGFVADNEAANGAAFRLLQPDFPFLIRVPCAAHTLQLVVKQLMKASRWKELRADVQHIFHSFFASQGGKERRQQLLAFQLAKGGVKPLELVRANTTRWNSELFACERLVQLSSFVQLIVEQRAEMWEELKQFVAFLKPFQIATDVVQRDTATLFDVYQQWGMLRAHVEKEPGSSRSQKELKKRWNTQVNGAAAVAAALVSLRRKKNDIGVTSEQLTEAREFIVSYGSQYISSFGLSDSELTMDELQGRLLLQLGAFLDRRGAFAKLDGQLALIEAADANWATVDVWALYDEELAVVAKALLNLPASEAAVERTFSAQGLVHTKLRNRLLDDAVQKEMFVSFNKAAISNKPLVQRPLVTTEEFMEDADFDTDIEDSEEEDEEVESAAEEESKDEVGEQPAAAASAVSMRSRSMVVASNTAFIDEFVNANPLCLSWRWNDEKNSALEAAAAEYSQEHGIATVGLVDLRTQLRRRAAASKH